MVVMISFWPASRTGDVVKAVGAGRARAWYNVLDRTLFCQIGNGDSPHPIVDELEKLRAGGDFDYALIQFNTKDIWVNPGVPGDRDWNDLPQLWTILGWSGK